MASSRESKAAYRTLYPRLLDLPGRHRGDAAGFFIGGWVLYVIQYGTVAVGHVAGQTRALFVREREAGIQPEVLHGLQAPAVLAAAIQASAPAGGCAPEPIVAEELSAEALDGTATAPSTGGEQ